MAKRNLFAKGRGGGKKPGSGGSGGSGGTEAPARSPRAMKRIAGGREVESRPFTFAEEAVVYVWHERNVLKLPSWTGAGSMQTGHAAMKLAVFDPDQATRQQVEYISWWPGSGADKNTEAKPGAMTKAYVQDRLNEMVHDKTIKRILTMQFLRRANSETEAERALFAEACKTLWDTMTTSVKAKMTEMGVQVNFANLDQLAIQARGNQKLTSASKLKAETTSSPLLRRRFRARAGLFSPKLQDGMSSDELAKLFAECVVVKQPYAKIYLPCSCTPQTAVADERYTPWGLSLSAMRMAFRAYEPGVRDYRMQSYSGNCIAAVWTTLKAGLADVFVKFQPTRGVVENLAHLTSLLPSDAIQASAKLSARLDQLRQQQRSLDVLATKYAELLGGLVEHHEWSGEAWREPLFDYKLWRSFSDAKGVRPVKKRKVDDAASALAKVEQALRRRSFDETQSLLQMEGRWEVRRHNSKTLLSNEDTLSTGLLVGDELLARQAQLEKLRSDSAKDLAAWEKEVGAYEKTRRDRAAALIELHQRIYDYVSSVDQDRFLDERFYSALLLSQLVAWRFVEVCHDNMTLTLEGVGAEGFRVEVRETSSEIADIYPHLRYVDKEERLAEGGVTVTGV